MASEVSFDDCTYAVKKPTNRSDDWNLLALEFNNNAVNLKYIYECIKCILKVHFELNKK